MSEMYNTTYILTYENKFGEKHESEYPTYEKASEQRRIWNNYWAGSGIVRKIYSKTVVIDFIDEVIDFD